jgi:hypothetical protein
MGRAALALPVVCIQAANANLPTLMEQANGDVPLVGVLHLSAFMLVCLVVIVRLSSHLSRLHLALSRNYRERAGMSKAMMDAVERLEDKDPSVALHKYALTSNFNKGAHSCVAGNVCCRRN